jgi:feruloyl esterase
MMGLPKKDQPAAKSIYCLIAIFVSAAVCNGGVPLNTSAIGLPPGVLGKWEQQLHQAGATAREIGAFEEQFKGASPDYLAGWQAYIENAGNSYFERYVLSSRRNREPELPAIFPCTAPILSVEELRNVSISNTTIDSATISPSGEYCRVTATVTHPPANDRVTIWIDLPVKGWNGRFRGTGGAGYAGGFEASLDKPVAKGWAVGATDAGNSSGSGSLAMGADGHLNWQVIRDNAYLGIHDMTVVGKALTEAFYGRAPRFSYFFGGSSGGRQALMEAQRFPGDYDGIVALYPAINRDRYVPAQLWPQVVMHEAKHFVSKAKLDAVSAAVVKLYGIDGIIADPLHCAYDLGAMVGTKVGDEIFTAEDAKIVRQIWNGAKGSGGRFLWYGLVPGSDLSVLASTRGNPLEGDPNEEGLAWFRYWLLQDPKWDWTTLNRDSFEQLFNQSVEEFGAVIGTDNPDLNAFKNRGGKLLIVHGLNDQVVPVGGTIQYYRDVEKRMGGPEQVAEFARLFLVPGQGHGFSAKLPAPSTAETVQAITAWIEDGRPPSHLG